MTRFYVGIDEPEIIVEGGVPTAENRDSLKDSIAVSLVMVSRC